MKSNADIPVDWPLIGKYLSGEASPEEAMAIDTWRSESNEHETLFQSALRWWDLSSEEKVYRPAQIDRQWEALQGTINRTPEKPGLKTTGRTFSGWKIAAGLLVLLGTSALFYVFRPHSGEFAPGQVVRSSGHTVKYTLPDSSTCILYPAGQLVLSDRYGSAGREVKLSGEGYFSVQRSGKPFILDAGGVKIIVLGTAFNVKGDPGKVSVAVKDGAIKMQAGLSAITVPAGATGVFYKEKDTLVLYKDSLNLNVFGYATREIYFNNASMEEVKETLEHMYHVKVILGNGALDRLRLDTQFKGRSLSYVAEVIGASLDLQYELRNDTLYFYESASD